MVNIVVARPLKSVAKVRPSASFVVCARNESENIDGILTRCPMMGPQDESIFVEGNSRDNTWKTIRQGTSNYKGAHRVIIARQWGKGKGDGGPVDRSHERVRSFPRKTPLISEFACSLYIRTTK